MSTHDKHQLIFIFCYLPRLIKAEEEHQQAIQEKIDLEMRLEEEMKSSKVMYFISNKTFSWQHFFE